MWGRNGSWQPDDFADSVDRALGAVLAGFEFTPVSRTPIEIVYRNSHVTLRFWWDRQEMDGMLSPHDPAVRGTEIDRAFALTEIFQFLGLTEQHKAFFLQLRTPKRFRSHLQHCADYLPKCRDFLMGDADAYAALRRSLEIRHLAYNWKWRDFYTDTEEITAYLLKEIRQNAVQWWQEGDFRSVAQVLEIIESHLTEDEREMLTRARSRVKSGADEE